MILKNNLSIYYNHISKKLINNYSSIFAIGRDLSVIHSLHDPTNSETFLIPLISSAKILWQAVIHDPHIDIMSELSVSPINLIKLCRNSSGLLKCPFLSKFLPRG